MDIQQFDTQIEAYFTGTLSPIDKNAFEESLKANKALQEAIKPYLMFNKAVEAVGQQAIKAMSKDIRAEFGSLPAYKPNLWEQITAVFTQIPADNAPWFKRPQWRVALSGVAMSLFGCLFYANVVVPPLEDLPLSKNFGKPEVTGNLGGISTETAFAICAELYEKEKLTELQTNAKSPNNTIATAGTYYLAHLYLKMKNFDAAISAFDKILLPNSITILKNQSMNIGTIKINQMLAFLGKTKNKIAVNQMIDKLENDADCQESPQKKSLKAIREELENPWRRLRFSR